VKKANLKGTEYPAGSSQLGSAGIQWGPRLRFRLRKEEKDFTGSRERQDTDVDKWA